MSQKKKEANEAMDKALDTALAKLSKEELLRALKDAIKQSDEIKSSTKGLMNHIKVLCHRIGGTITYTKDEFDAAAQDNSNITEVYGLDGKKEICTLKLVPPTDKANIS